MGQKWDKLLRVGGIAGLLVAYLIYALEGGNLEVFIVVVLAIGTLVSPEFVDRMPFGPSK